jgi:hypothetical protein
MKNGWLIAAALVGCTTGVGLVACSSSTTGNTTAGNTSTNPASSVSSTSSSGTGGATTGTATGGTTTGTATGGATSSSASSTSTTTSGTTTSTECDAVTVLHPPKLDAGAGTIYCPFSEVTDGGPDMYCTPISQHCCETPEDAGVATACQPFATACMTGTGYTDWQCEDPVVDCTTTAAPVCCAPGATIGLGGTVNNMACGNFAHTMTHTTCVAAGACTGIIMCTSDSECPAATPTCTPFGKAGNAVGGCM